MISYKTFLNEGIKVYHGAKEHGRRVIGHTGTNSTVLGPFNSTRYGVFFSTVKAFSSIYGEVVPYELSLSKTKIVDMVSFNKHANYYPNSHDFEKWAKANHPEANWSYPYHTWEWFEDELGKLFYEFCTSLGFDAATFEEWDDDDNGKEIKGRTYVLFNLHKVRKKPDPKQPDLFLK